MGQRTIAEQVVTNQYLTFLLDNEIFALKIEKVREVLDYIMTTPVPRMPDFIRGIINLRGKIITVVDLRLKFGISETVKSRDTCIIIVEVSVDNELSTIGLLADSVLEVFDISNNELDPPPKMGLRLDTKFIKGMSRKGDKFIIILNLDLLLESDQKAMVHSADDAQGVDLSQVDSEHIVTGETVAA